MLGSQYISTGFVPQKPLKDTSFKYEQLQMELSKERKPRPPMNQLQPGQYSHYTDHMFECKWSADGGWKVPKITPFHDLSLHPAAKVFNYAYEMFEDLRAYRGVDGKVRLFRPMLYLNRMVESAKRGCLPTFDPRQLLNIVKRLVSIDYMWVPPTSVASLHIRLCMIAIEPCLSLARTNAALIFIIMAPNVPTHLVNIPIHVYADPTSPRMWKGGANVVKLGSNYATSFYIQQQNCEKNNCDQILWLCGHEHFITELGTMNFFCFWINENKQEEVITPPLEGGMIMPGIIRQTILEIIPKMGNIKVKEAPIEMSHVVTALNQNRIKELFAANTVDGIVPIHRITYKNKPLQIPTMREGAPLVTKLAELLHNIFHGSSPWSGQLMDEVTNMAEGDDEDVSQ